LNEKFEYQIAKSFVKSNDIVVDAGCGRGAFFQQIADLNIQFTGIETSNKAVEMAIQDDINVVNTSLVDFSDTNKDFADVVTSFQVCEHISELKGFIESKIKIVKSGGRMIIAVPSDDSFISSNVNGILNMPPHHISRWTDKVFHFIAKTYNLKLEKIIHEELQEHHHNFYLKNLMENKMIQYKMIDLSLKRLFASKIFYYISISASIFCKPKKDIYGHTVVAVFKKE
jgi:2-polyprenyl-3-methyl-5-hydroxy-6-metoxy-1,4-benzoquinol methylase